MESRQTRFAHRISIALIPPTIAAAAFAVLVLAYEHGSIFHRIVVWIVATLCAGGLQMLYVLSLRRRAEVTAYDVPERRQRTKPYAVSAGLSLAGVLMLLYMNASVFVWGLMWCFFINTLILGLINLRWKISAHMMGFTGPVVFLFPLVGWTLLILLPLAILLGWARITLRAHTLPQVLAGAAAGLALTLVQAWVILELLLPMMQ